MTQRSSATTSSTSADTTLALDEISVRENVRELDTEHVDALAQSIKLRGLLVPVIVRPVHEEDAVDVPASDAGEVLRGAAIRRVATQLPYAQHGPPATIHYRDWLATAGMRLRRARQEPRRHVPVEHPALADRGASSAAGHVLRRRHDRAAPAPRARRAPCRAARPAHRSSPRATTSRRPLCASPHAAQRDGAPPRARRRRKRRGVHHRRPGPHSPGTMAASQCATAQAAATRTTSRSNRIVAHSQHARRKGLHGVQPR
jgi:ParB-like nuclease domain